jgi:outer membrane usher protein
MARLLCAVALSALWTAEAHGQVTVPLPSAPRPASPTPPPASPPGAPATTVPLPTLGQPEVGRVPIGAHGRPDINPYERDIDMTVPLIYRGHNLGDVPVRLTFDDQFFVETAGFLKLIDPLISAPAKVKLAGALNGKARFAAEDLTTTGIALDYDPASLSIVVLRIDPAERAIERLFEQPQGDHEVPDLLPAHFSGYLNINVFEGFQWEGRTDPPSVSLNGAIRLGRVVLEGDGGFSNQASLGSAQNYGFVRNYARLVYDQPEDFRRWFLGDLSPEIRGEQSFVEMGGIGVLRERRSFNDLRSAVLEGNRQLVLQRDSTVSILRNGTLYRQLQLNAGTYDLSALPLLAGSNDVQIQVRDKSGAIQNISYQAYLDPIDLEPGDFEYGAYLGRTSSRLGQNPHYNGPLAFSGFYRKAFLNAPAIGLGLQASHQVQNLTGQTQFLIGHGARILVDAGASNAEHIGQGFSLGLSYDQVIDRGGLTDYFTIRADYLTPKYASLGNLQGLDPSALNISGQYTHAITTKLTILGDGDYIKGRSGQRDSYRIGAAVNYYFSREWSVQTGVQYSHFPGGVGLGNGLGVNVALVFQPNYRTRAEARYDSAIDNASLSYLRSSSDTIGSIGYGAVVARQQGTIDAQAFADYIGNRFDASVSQGSSGASFSSFGHQNVTTIRVGTSLAFADGVFGVGRRINDSFALVYPNPNLDGRSVVAGQSLARNDYISKSGTFGAAVNNFLASYVNQSVQYDVEDPPLGYDIGPGVVRVRPPYRSGYAVRVGADAFVSSVGTLLRASGQPVSLVAGRVVPLTPNSGEPVPFFTNSIGRFAIANLRPGVKYRVELYSADGSVPAFEFTVPQDTTGLVDLHVVSLPPAH